MPVKQAKYVWIWPDLCEKRFLKEPVAFKTSNYENILILIMSGNPVLVCGNSPEQLSPRKLVYVARNSEITLSSDDRAEYCILHLNHTSTNLRFDLNSICTASAHVDTFFSMKSHVTVLQDTAFLHITMGAIRYELHNHQSDWEMLVSALLSELFIKLARCYQAQQKFKGIQFVIKARSFIQEQYNTPLSVERIAAYTGISRSYLSSLFSQCMSRTVIEYVNLVRCEKAAELLESTQFSIIDIAIEVGFNSRQHFTRTFTNLYGLSPNEYRRMSLLAPPDVNE